MVIRNGTLRQNLRISNTFSLSKIVLHSWDFQVPFLDPLYIFYGIAFNTFSTKWGLFKPQNFEPSKLQVWLQQKLMNPKFMWAELEHNIVPNIGICQWKWPAITFTPVNKFSRQMLPVSKPFQYIYTCVLINNYFMLIS